MKNFLVVKVGGALLNDNVALQSVLKVLRRLQEQFAPVLVHGGGDTTQALLEKLAFNSEKVDGVRVTPKTHLPYVVGALAGTVNTEICAAASVCDLKPVGLTLLDGNACQATQKSVELGAVGDVIPGDPALLKLLCSQGYLPVISSIASDAQGNLLNVNADDAAATIAQLLAAELVLLSDVPGVLDADKVLLSSLNRHSIAEHCASGVIQGGMVVKVKSALATANQTGKSVFISSWKSPEQLLALTQGEPCGTRIQPDNPAQSV